jgi:hypothetical protein
LKNNLFSLAPALSAFAFLSLTAATEAQVITVPNHDLQVDPTYTNTVQDTGAANNVIQDFIETNNTAGHYGSNGVTAPDGTIAAFVNTDGSGTITLTNDLTADGTVVAPDFVAGDTYTFTLAIGVNPTNGNAYNFAGTVDFGLLANGKVVGTPTDVPAGTVPDGPNSTANFENFTYSYTATTTDAGDAIGLQISVTNPGASQTEFSNIRLNASAVPEPSTWAMLFGGLGLLVFVRRLRGQLAL